MSCSVPQTLHLEIDTQQQIPDYDVQLSYKLPRELAHNHLLVLSLTSLNHTFPSAPFHSPRMRCMLKLIIGEYAECGEAARHASLYWVIRERPGT